MQLLQALTNKCANIKHEVGELLGQHSKDESTASAPRAKQAEFYDLTVDSSEPLSADKPSRKFRTLTVPTILDEDDREHVDTIQDLGRTQRGKKDRADNVSAQRSLGSTLTEPSPRHKVREISSPQEKRVLGEAEPVPKDAVRIRIPRSQSPRAIQPMPGSRKPAPFRPTDTLNQVYSRPHTHTSRKHDLIRHHKAAGSSKLHGSQQRTDETLPLDAQTKPSKRRRIDYTQNSKAQPPEIIDIVSGDDEASPHKYPQTRTTLEGFPPPLRRGKRRDSLSNSEPRGSKRVRQSSQESASDDRLDVTQNPDNGSSILDNNTDFKPSVHQISPVMNNAYQASNAEIRQHQTTKHADERPRKEGGARSNPNRYAPADDSPDELHSNLLTTHAKLRRSSPLKTGKENVLGAKRHLQQLQPRQKINRHELKGCKVRIFPLLSFVGLEGSDHAQLELVLVPELKWFWVFIENPSLGDESITGVLLSNVMKIYYAEKTIACKVAGGSIPGGWSFLNFKSAKSLYDFLQLAQPHIRSSPEKVGEEDIEKRIAQARKISTDHQKSQASRAAMKMTPEQSKSHQTSMEEGDEVGDRFKRRRRHENLDFPSSPDPLTVITPADRRAATEEHSQHADDFTETHLTSRQILRRTTTTSRYFNSGNTPRQTRSQVVRHRNSLTPDPDSEHSGVVIANLVDHDFRKPLTIHGPQKKRESLSAEDVNRLNDNEFLNDNIISFFLLFLQNQVHADQLKRMYFFNTFFFSALTKDTRGRNSVNYDAVSRWTKNVNLFARDFLIVPVNENLHWYVMIICNLPALKNIAERIEDGDSDTIEEISPSDREPLQEIVQILEVPSPEATRESFQELSLEDESGPQEPSQNHSSKRKNRKIGRSWTAKKYDPKKPVIITLDSLGQSRSSTAVLLKKYIVAVAADPNQHGGTFSIDANSISGMTAKGIPQQSNFSDCGLYLCMYLEQFMLDPDMFVYKILQREGNQVTESPDVSGHDLRIRLAETIGGLARQHRGASDQSIIPPLGSILNRAPTQKHGKQTVSPTLVRPEQIITHASIVDARKRWTDSKISDQEHRRQQHSPPQPSTTGRTDNEVAELGTKAIMNTNSRPSESTASQSVSPGHTSCSPVGANSFDLHLKAGDSGSTPLRAIEALPNTLAARIARERSPAKFLDDAKEQQPHEIGPNVERSHSVSTDFLVGDRSWRLATHEAERYSSDLETAQHPSQAVPAQITTATQHLDRSRNGPTIENSASDDNDDEDHGERDEQSSAKEVTTGMMNPKKHAVKGYTSRTSNSDNTEMMLV